MLVGMVPLPEHPDFTPAMRLAVRADEVRDAMAECEKNLREAAAPLSVTGWSIDEEFANKASERYDFVRPDKGPHIVVGKLRIIRA